MTYIRSYQFQEDHNQLHECQVSIKSLLSILSYNKCKRLDEILET